MDRQRRKRAGVADDLDLPRAAREPAFVVPHGRAGADGHPAPPQDVLHGNVGDRPDCPLQGRGRGGVSLGDQQGETVEQQVEWTRSTRRPREGPHGAADLDQDVPGGDVLRQPRRAPGGQVGLAREVQVERLEPPGGLQQQRGSVAPKTRGEGDVGTQQVDPGALELVERPGLRRGDQPESRVEFAGLQARLRRGQRAIRPPRRVLRQRDGALQERRRGGEPAARLRPAGRALELQGDLLVRPRRGRGQMPRTTVRVGLPIGRLRQRQMDRAALLCRRRPVHRRAHQRMAERHPLADRQQPVRLRGLRGRRPDPEPLGRAPQQQRIADRLRRRDQQQTPRVVRERLESPDEALLDPPCQRLRAQQAEAARQLRRRQPPRQLEQRQRIPARLGDDPVPDCAHPT